MRSIYITIGEFLMESPIVTQWNHDLQDFIAYWNQELDNIRRRRVDSNECVEIMDTFHKNMDYLLLRRPAEIIEDEYIGQLQPLLNKLDASLAMALCSMKFETSS
jgi:hypothetical protein